MRVNQLLAQILASHFSQLTDRISRFTETGYSFEEWINWECYHAFSTRRMTCYPKPNYKEYGEGNNKRLGDFCVTLLTGEALFCEVKLVHDHTQDKWMAEIEKDREALSSVENVTPIQILFCTSTFEDVFESSDWARFLEGLSFWKDDKVASVDLSLPNKGQLLIKIWEVN